MSQEFVDRGRRDPCFFHHPEQWPHGGYNEIKRPRRKNILIDYDTLGHLSGYNNFDDFQKAHGDWVEAALSSNKMQREACWTQSIATGSQPYVRAVRNKMGGFAIGRQIRKSTEGFELREPQRVYNPLFRVENKDIEGENLWFWDV
jgi:REP-associated tyrosine transposase